jgi:hypothetical protein
MPPLLSHSVAGSTPPEGRLDSCPPRALGPRHGTASPCTSPQLDHPIPSGHIRAACRPLGLQANQLGGTPVQSPTRLSTSRISSGVVPALEAACIWICRSWYTGHALRASLLQNVVVIPYVIWLHLSCQHSMSHTTDTSSELLIVVSDHGVNSLKINRLIS